MAGSNGRMTMPGFKLERATKATDTACEYWHRRASLVHTDTQGNDLPPDRGALAATIGLQTVITG